MAVLDDLKRLSAAEEFFEYLGVSCDPEVLGVARLHILRRMGQYLTHESLAGLDDDTMRERCRNHLAQAYRDFLESSPLQERVFKVLKDAVAPKSSKLVQLEPLTKED